jgi:hypothetical protein
VLVWDASLLGPCHAAQPRLVGAGAPGGAVLGAGPAREVRPVLLMLWLYCAELRYGCVGCGMLFRQSQPSRAWCAWLSSAGHRTPMQGEACTADVLVAICLVCRMWHVV